MKAPELKDLAISWLRSEYPTATIVVEMSVANWGGAVIDVAAITDEMVIGVEIKGEGDSPARLELQGLRYGQVAKEMWLLVTPEGTLADRCYKKKPVGWGRLEIIDGKARPYNLHRVASSERVTRPDGGYSYPYIRSEDEYRPESPASSVSLNPWAMCGTLWRDELMDIARGMGLKLLTKTRVHEVTDAIIDAMPVPAIHDAMILQLRKRVWRKSVIDPRDPDQKGWLL